MRLGKQRPTDPCRYGTSSSLHLRLEYFMAFCPIFGGVRSFESGVRLRISRLAATTCVPLATVKFYLRELLLHDGELTAPNHAQYDESHVRRLRLVRALLGPGGLQWQRPAN